MDDPRQLPHMICDGDMLSIYECMECGAVVRDVDTHVGWHATRPWSEPTVVNNLNCECGRCKPCRHCVPINRRDACSLSFCDNEAYWQVPTVGTNCLSFLLCREHLQDVQAMNSFNNESNLGVNEDIIHRLLNSCAHVCARNCSDENAYAVGVSAAHEISRLRNEVDMKGYRLDDALEEIARLREENKQLLIDAIRRGNS